MAYATLQDLIDRFGEEELIQLTDRADPPAEAVDATTVERALADAGHLIDGYVAGRYALPMDPVPDLVKRLACDLARYLLHTHAATEVVKDNHRDALRALADIAAGRITLQAAGISAPAAGDAVQASAPERIFTRDSLGGF